MEDKKITKIVLTGGPCAGKSTAIELIRNKLMHLGFNVAVIEEGATYLMKNGLSPQNMREQDFQFINLQNQIRMEENMEEYAKKLSKPTIIICDRGALDAKAYAGEKLFNEITSKLNTSEQDLKNRYDLVIFLNSMATLGKEHYSKENNQHRRENYEEALDANARTLNAWVGHPKLRPIQNEIEFKSDITKKIEKIMQEITSFMGIPMPLEIERKYLIEKPNIASLKNYTEVEESQIQQTYLTSPKDKEIRIRKHTSRGVDSYFYTQKTKNNNVSRFEVEQKITKQEYDYLNNFADPNKETIHKTRYYFVHNGQYFELDVYPFLKKYAILELELADENKPVQLPDYLTVVREITEESAYKNSNIASLLKTLKNTKQHAMSCPEISNFMI